MSGQGTDEGEPALPGGGSAAPKPVEPVPAAPKEPVPDAPKDGAATEAVEQGINDDGVLTVSTEDLELPTPVLEEPKISPDAAAEASLEDAVSEAQSVAKEAQKAGTLVGGRLPTDPAAGRNTKSDDAVARKIEAAAAKAKANLATNQAADEADATPSSIGTNEGKGGNDIDKNEPSDSRKDADQSNHHPDEDVDESAGTEAEYPSSPGARQNPQEPVSEESATEAGSKEPSENYPAMPEHTKKSKSRREPGDGPGAAKISEPHERDDRVPRRGRRAYTAPPAPNRAPAQAPVQASDETSRFPATEQYRRPQPEAGGAEDSGRYSRPASSWQGPQYDLPAVAVRQRPKKSKAPLFIGLGIALALILGVVLLIIALTSLLSNRGADGQGSAEAEGVIAENVSPFDFQQGQCFRDFTDATQEATVVSCSSPHEAQLVNTFLYDANDAFPGEEELIQRADELCRNTQLNDAAQNYELRQQTAYPQPESWAQGDRRVDCFIRVPDGGLTESLID